MAEMKIYTKAYVKEINEDEATITAVASTETVDRDREVIRIDAWKLENFQKNPVLIWAHNYGLPPIGRVLWVKKDGKALKFKAQFHRKTQLSNEIWELYKAGHLHAFSVGFIPRKWKDLEEGENTEVRRIFEEVELLEISAVPVPANPDALVEAINTGEVTIRSKSLLKMLNAEIDIKRVIPFKHYPLAPEDYPWNAPKEVRQADVDDLKIMCTWYDAENPDVKSSYKLPHHRAKDYYTVWRGVAAAMAALMGARGGVNVPDSDRKGIYNHLVKHYKEFDKEPPEFREYTEQELKEMFPEVYEMSEEEWKAIIGELEFKDEEKTETAFDIIKALIEKLAEIENILYRIEEKIVVLGEKLGEADERPPETSGDGEVREVIDAISRAFDKISQKYFGRDEI